MDLEVEVAKFKKKIVVVFTLPGDAERDIFFEQYVQKLAKSYQGDKDVAVYVRADKAKDFGYIG